MATDAAWVGLAYVGPRSGRGTHAQAAPRLVVATWLAQRERLRADPLLAAHTADERQRVTPGAQRPPIAQAQAQAPTRTREGRPGRVHETVARERGLHRGRRELDRARHRLGRALLLPTALRAGHELHRARGTFLAFAACRARLAFFAGGAFLAFLEEHRRDFARPGHGHFARVRARFPAAQPAHERVSRRCGRGQRRGPFDLRGAARAARRGAFADPGAVDLPFAGHRHRQREPMNFGVERLHALRLAHLDLAFTSRGFGFAAFPLRE